MVSSSRQTLTEKSDARTKKVQIPTKCMRKTEVCILEHTDNQKIKVTFTDSKKTVASTAARATRQRDSILVQTGRYNTGHVSSTLDLTHFGSGRLGSFLITTFLASSRFFSLLNRSSAWCKKKPNILNSCNQAL